MDLWSASERAYRNHILVLIDTLIKLIKLINLYIVEWLVRQRRDRPGFYYWGQHYAPEREKRTLWYATEPIAVTARVFLVSCLVFDTGEVNRNLAICKDECVVYADISLIRRNC